MQRMQSSGAFAKPVREVGRLQNRKDDGPAGRDRPEHQSSSAAIKVGWHNRSHQLADSTIARSGPGPNVSDTCATLATTAPAPSAICIAAE